MSIYTVLVTTFLLIWLAWAVSKRLRKRREIDEQLPRALLELSALRITTMQDVVKHLSKGYGALSTVFQDADRMISAGIPATHALTSAARASGSYLLENAVSVIITGMRSGADISELLRKTAEDIEAVVDMERERASALILQKYVVLLSAGIFVPLVLGITKRMTDQLVATTALEKTSILLATQNAMLIHIIALALLSSVFAAVLEGEIKNTIVYLAVLIPLAVVTYAAAGGWGI